MIVGDGYRVAPSLDSLTNELPVGNYVVAATPTGELFFKKSENFTDSGKIYGDHERRAERILHTAMDRTVNTGVLLAGERGSGKSLLARLISEKGAALGMPTILVKNDFDGSSLSPLFNSLESPAVIIFDEFEKVYHQMKEQESILSILDGTATSKHIYVFTVNDTVRLSRYLSNRPGRLYYNITFDGLDDSFIESYCQDKLQDKSRVAEVLKISLFFDKFNFDMLKALVEEMNRYGESAEEAVKMLNIRPHDDVSSYTVTIHDKTGTLLFRASNFNGNPLSLQHWDIDSYDLIDEPEDLKWKMLTVNSSQLSKVDIHQGIFTFDTENYQVILHRERASEAAHWAAF